MILTDREIKIYIQRGLITVDPQPPDIAYQSSSLDLTLDPTISVFKEQAPTAAGLEQNTIIDPTNPDFRVDAILREITQNVTLNKDEGYLLQPRTMILAWTAEYVDLKESRLAARVEGKSSLARVGIAVHMTAPTIHAGFEGRIRLEMVNHGPLPIRLKPEMRICQLVFEQTFGTPDKIYRGQFSGQTTS